MNKNEQPSKSLADIYPVNDQAFPLNRNPGTSPQSLQVVSSCPACGSPIYGAKTLRDDQKLPSVRLTCDCLQRQRSFAASIQTKDLFGPLDADILR